MKQRKLNKNTIKVLSRYPWPGNVRELQNVIFRTLFLAKQPVIEAADLPPDIFMDKKVQGKRLVDVEREHILRVLHEAGGKKRKAAEILGVDPKTLYRKLTSYGIKG